MHPQVELLFDVACPAGAGHQHQIGRVGHETEVFVRPMSQGPADRGNSRRATWTSGAMAMNSPRSVSTTVMPSVASRTSRVCDAMTRASSTRPTLKAGCPQHPCSRGKSTVHPAFFEDRERRPAYLRCEGIDQASDEQLDLWSLHVGRLRPALLHRGQCLQVPLYHLDISLGVVRKLLAELAISAA